MPLGQWQATCQVRYSINPCDESLDGFEGYSMVFAHTSSNSIQDFKNENMTQIAQHDMTCGCLLQPTSGQPKVTTGAMFSEKMCGRTNCRRHHLKNGKVGGKEQTQSAIAISIQTYLRLNICIM